MNSGDLSNKVITLRDKGNNNNPIEINLPSLEEITIPLGK